MRKVLLWILFLAGFIALKIHHEQPSPLRIRKSINSLNETERKSLFWTIKMMAILPVPHSFGNWTYQSLLKLPSGDPSLQPQRIIDVLLSSHSTSCEHSSIYFAHYHRHMMVLAELFLNIAHKILRQGRQRLLELYHPSLYEEHSQLWNSIFEIYEQQKMGQLSVISIHYWNPTNFKDKDDLLVPIELAGPFQNPDRKIDVMDKLFYAVLGHWPWETNVKTRLISPKYKWNQTEVQQSLEKIQFFPQKGTETQYTHDQILILHQKLTPRTQPQGRDFDDFQKTYQKYSDTKNGATYKSLTPRRFKEYFRTIGKNQTLPLSALKQEEVFTMFGAQISLQKQGEPQKYEFQYISKAERRDLNLADEITKNYNNRLPHYAMAFALFNKEFVPTFKDFLKHDNGIKNSHDLMHGHRGFFLKDPLNSVIANFFFFYHSWIDMNLQIKIRLSNHEDQIQQTISHFESLKDNLENGDRNNEQFIIKTILRNPINRLDVDRISSTIYAEMDRFNAHVTTNHQSSFPSILNSTKTGSYLVFEWFDFSIDQKIRNNQSYQRIFVAAFPMRDYMITPTHIRTSKELSELYRRIYIKNNGWRFEGLIDLKSFPFDYDYQVDNGPAQPAQVLNEDASNMPSYILAMRGDVQEVYGGLISALDSVIQVVYNRNFSQFYIDQPSWKTLRGQDPDALKEKLANYYQSYLFNNSFTLARFPSTLKQQRYPIRMSLQNSDCFSDAKQLLEANNVSADIIDQLSRGGIAVQNLSIRSSACRGCAPERQILLDLGADLLSTNETLWKVLRILQLGESGELADSRFTGNGEDPHATCISRTVHFAASSLAQDQPSIQVRYLRGAENVKLFVDLQDGSEDRLKDLNKKLEVSVKSAPVGADEALDFVLTRADTQKAKGAKFVFYSSVPSRQPRVTNHIEATLYRQIEIKWDSKVQISFQIPYYSRIANFRLFVGFQEGFDVQGPYFVLEDADFAVKQQLLRQFSVKPK